jgi:protein-disulfide isomerase
MARVGTIGLLIAVCAGWAACTGGTDGGTGLKGLQQGQKKILERLEKIEKTQQEILTSLKQRSPRRAAVDYNKVYNIKIGDSPVRGSKDAAVTLVEFSDFQCPYSGRAQPLITKLMETYPNDLRHVFKNFPLRFHKHAMPAAKACMAAHLQGKFWEMDKLVFENQRKLDDKDLRRYAAKIGLDMQRFDKDFKSDAVAKQVEADLQEGRRVRVTGTPTLFLNGKRVRKRSVEAMKKEIDAILKGKKKS